jgi:hypothetical protein
MYKAARLVIFTCSFAAALACAQAADEPAADASTPPATVQPLSVQVLSASQMTRQDADLLAARRQDIVSAAEFNGYNLSAGSWIQTQVACSDAPNYLIMHYLKLNADSSVSLFTAVLPRGQAQVRIIPVMYHGAQALRVFGSSPGQRDFINQVISTMPLAEAQHGNPSWATLAFCYAALAGAEPSPNSITSPEETTPRLVVDADGKVRAMSFTVRGPDHLYQDWSVLFDQHTEVKSIALTARPIHSPEKVQGSRSTMKPHPVRDSQSTLKSRPVPQ